MPTTRRADSPARPEVVAVVVFAALLLLSVGAAPARASRTSYGELIPYGGSRLLALAYSFPRPARHGGRHLPASYSVAELTTSGRRVRSFGRDGFTRPMRFARGTGTVVRANAIARQGRRILVAAQRETRFGETAPLLIAYRPDGRIDRSFGRDGRVAPRPKVRRPKDWEPSRFSDVAVRPGGGIVAVGVIRHGHRQAALVAAYRPDGRVDRSFGHDGRVVVPERFEWTYGGFDSVLVLPDGKLLLAGPDDHPFGRMKLMRLDADGRRDRTFGAGNGVATVKDRNSFSCCAETVFMASGGHGRILVAGASGRPESSVTLARLHPDGSPDPSFGVAGLARFSSRRAPGYFKTNAMTVGRGGEILVVGDIEGAVKGRYGRLPAVLAYRPDGKVDGRFGHRGVAVLSRRGWGGLAGGAATLGDGRVFVAGGLYERGPRGRPLRPFLRELGRDG